MRLWRVLAAVAVVVALVPATASAERVIIQIEKPYGKMVKKIQRLGGTVLYQYRYIDAIAADIPDGAMDQARQGLNRGSVHKDLIVTWPDVARELDGSRRVFETAAGEAIALDAAEIAAIAATDPDAYLIGNTYLNIDSVHAMGYAGQGVVVAVLDSGYRPGFPHVEVGWSSVIGGEDVTGDSYGWSNWSNDGHGTFVAGMIASHVAYTFSPFLTSVVASYCPACVLPGGLIPMIGSAPAADIYMVKVLSEDPAFPNYISKIIYAMERVLEIKDNYLAGDPVAQNPDGSYDSLDIQVCNMSLGWISLFSGREVGEQLTNAFLDRDIMLAVSMGNEGPAGMTGGAVGSGFGSLTVGAASSDVHERIVRDLQYGPGVGGLYRPWNGLQTAFFSSRGPTPDGRPDPEIVANGDWNFGQGFGSSPAVVNFASGTSFSSPSVAGVAAVLRGAVPTATARQVRNALIMSANPGLVADGSGPLDQGHGYADAQAAYDLLLTGTVPDTPGEVGGTNKNVKVNILQGAGVETFDDIVTRSVSQLLPGQRFDTTYRIKPNTAALVVTVTDFVPGSPQNPFFGNDLILTVHTAKTSRMGFNTGDYLFAGYVTTTDPLVFTNLDEGLMRVTLLGDWTNAAPVDATINIYSVSASIPGLTSQSKIGDGDLFVVPFEVPTGTSSLDGHLSWRGHWGQYPVNDIDVILVDPDGAPYFDGATFASPERIHIDDPVPGQWFALVDGYTVYDGHERYELVLEADGTAIH